jgi:hypothetical protein
VSARSVAIIGYGAVGKNLHQFFPGAAIYDEPLGRGTRDEVNGCDIAFVGVPTNPRPDGSCDTSIVDGATAGRDRQTHRFPARILGRDPGPRLHQCPADQLDRAGR